MRSPRVLVRSGTPLRATWACVAGLAVVSFPGCARQQRGPAAAEPPTIPVSKPVVREVTDFVDFTGRTNAVESVNIIPRVTGYLVQIPFKEGSEIEKGDLLFEVDPRPYQAQLDQAMGQIQVFKAQQQLAKVTLDRDKELLKKGAVTQQQVDQDQAALDESVARVKAYESSSEIYKLNIEFTKVASPIDGMVGRRFLTLGNLVNQDQTLLTTVVSLDPMYVYFDIDEQTLLRVRRAVSEGRIKLPEDKKFPVSMGLQTEEDFPHQGTIDFVNNQINPATGSMLVRGVFQNPKPDVGFRLLSPGMFVRVRLLIGQPYQAILVIDRAISSDQGLKYVYVVDDDGVVQTRRVKTGALQPDGLRVIQEGLKSDETVVVGALQQIQPRMKVKTEAMAMPSMQQPAAPQGAAPAGEGTDAPPPNENSKSQAPDSKQGPNPKSQ